jgi:hypothetical protein
MTDPAWAASTDPLPMLAVVRDRLGAGPLCRFAAACCRRAAGRLTDPRSRGAAADLHGLAARLAAGGAGGDPWRAYFDAWHASAAAATAAGYAADADTIAALTSADVDISATQLPQARLPSGAARAERAAELAGQALLLREIAGDPWRPSRFDPAWSSAHGATAWLVAAAIVADAAFERMPILADALQDAGCTDGAILAHCRQGDPHDPGCWVLAGVLGGGRGVRVA